MAGEIGTIVVNVEMFASDSQLRDKRIRSDFLESTKYPFATLEPTLVEGLPATLTEGQLTLQFDLAAGRVELSSPGAGGSGWSTVSIGTAGEAAEIAYDIALVSRSLYMPPWPASGMGVELKHNWSLSRNEIDVLAGWASAGGGIDTAVDYRCQIIEIPTSSVMAHGFVGSVSSPTRTRWSTIPSCFERRPPRWQCFGLAGLWSCRARRPGLPDSRPGSTHATDHLPRWCGPATRARRLSHRPDPLSLRGCHSGRRVSDHARHPHHRGDQRQRRPARGKPF